MLEAPVIVALVLSAPVLQEIKTLHKNLYFKGINAVLSRIWKCRKSRIFNANFLEIILEQVRPSFGDARTLKTSYSEIPSQHVDFKNPLGRSRNEKYIHVLKVCAVVLQSIDLKHKVQICTKKGEHFSG